MGEYNNTFVTGLEHMWGDGFMSPGGLEEVAAVLDGVDLVGKRVLDIGCGIGGIDLLLVREFGAAHVTGIDVESPLIERAQAVVDSAELQKKITIQLVEPGPLPFPDNSFDVVFSKDAIIHIPDKCAIYADMYRVLASGGRVAFSDWFGSVRPKTPEFDAWYAVLGLTFEMAPIEEAADLLASVGFADVKYDDRNAWYAQNMLEELVAISGDNYARLEAAVGVEAAAQRLESSQRKKQVVDQGLLRPGHVRAMKP